MCRHGHTIECVWNAFYETIKLLARVLATVKYRVVSNSYLHDFIDEGQNPRLVREQQGLHWVKVV